MYTFVQFGVCKCRIWIRIQWHECYHSITYMPIGSCWSPAVAILVIEYFTLEFILWEFLFSCDWFVACPSSPLTHCAASKNNNSANKRGEALLLTSLSLLCSFCSVYKASVWAFCKYFVTLQPNSNAFIFKLIQKLIKCELP